MSHVPEIMLGVLALLILLGFFAGPSSKRIVHPYTGLGAGQAAGANVAERQGIDSAAGNTPGQVMSTPRISKEPQVNPSKES
jgi:hypothetical protein